MVASLSFTSLFSPLPSLANPSPRRLHSWNSTRFNSEVDKRPPNLKCFCIRRSFGLVCATMNQKTDTSSGVKVAEGHGELDKVCLSSVNGSEAEIYLFGACITSWKASNGKDLLFVRPDAVFNGQKPISGGIPHCFPQFGPGALQQHGFARNMEWSLLDSDNIGGEPVVTLELKDGPYSRSLWDFGFQALYKVKLSATGGLSTALTITNTDKNPFSFTTALHTYFRASISGVSVQGLKGCKTLNKDPDPVNPVESTEERDVVTFPGFVDCVYLDAPNELQLENGLGDTITIRNTKPLYFGEMEHKRRSLGAKYGVSSPNTPSPPRSYSFRSPLSWCRCPEESLNSHFFV